MRIRKYNGPSTRRPAQDERCDYRAAERAPVDSRGARHPRRRVEAVEHGMAVAAGVELQEVRVEFYLFRGTPAAGPAAEVPL